MRSDLEHNRASQIGIFSSLFGMSSTAMTTDLVLTKESSFAHFYDPNGSDRTIILPPLERGRGYVFAHTGEANSITLKDSETETEQVSLTAGVMLWVISSGEAWRTGPGAFGGAGVGHKAGLVPDPGPVDGLDRVLGDDGEWTTLIDATTMIDAYKIFSDGTNTSTAAGLSQFKLRSSNGSVDVTVTNNDGTHGDNADLVVDATGVDHDSLLNFSANEHIDHTAVTLTAGVGLSGGGTIAANRTFALDLSELSTVAVASSDTFPFWDDSGNANGKLTFATLNSTLAHNTLLGYSANRHIDHSTVSVTGGTGLSGGGTIETTRTISLGINSLTEDFAPISGDDFVLSYDVSEALHKKVKFSSFLTDASVVQSANIPWSGRFFVTTATETVVIGLGVLAGDYDVWGTIGIAPNDATTNIARIHASVGATSGSVDQTIGNQIRLVGVGTEHNGGDYFELPVPSKRISLPAGGNVYLNVLPYFTVSTLLIFGAVSARRVS